MPINYGALALMSVVAYAINRIKSNHSWQELSRGKVFNAQTTLIVEVNGNQCMRGTLINPRMGVRDTLNDATTRRWINFGADILNAPKDSAAVHMRQQKQ